MIFKNSKPILIILALVSVVCLTLLIWEVYNIRLQNKNASELISVADNDARIENLSQSIRVMQSSAAEDLKKFDDLVLSGDKLVSFIENIEGTSKIFGLDTNIVSVEKIEDKQAVEPDAIRIVMETKGAWSSSASFLRTIESLPYRVKIDGLNLSKDENDWHLKIILSFYTFD
ncbi:MAG: hypothetical protein AAB586_00945 [Patescibacteria group bacterium]